MLRTTYPAPMYVALRNGVTQRRLGAPARRGTNPVGAMERGTKSANPTPTRKERATGKGRASSKVRVKYRGQRFKAQGTTTPSKKVSCDAAAHAKRGGSATRRHWRRENVPKNAPCSNVPEFQRSSVTLLQLATKKPASEHFIWVSSEKTWYLDYLLLQASYLSAA